MTKDKIDETYQDYEEITQIIEELYEIPNIPKEKLRRAREIVNKYHYSDLTPREMFYQIIQRPGVLRAIGIGILIILAGIFFPHEIEKIIKKFF